MGIISGGGEFVKGKGDCVGSSTGFNVVPIGFISVVDDVVNFINVGNTDSMTMTILDNLFKITEKLIDNEKVDNEE